MFDIDSETVFHNIKSVIGDKKIVSIEVNFRSCGPGFPDADRLFKEYDLFNIIGLDVSKHFPITRYGTCGNGCQHWEDRSNSFITNLYYVDSIDQFKHKGNKSVIEWNKLELDSAKKCVANELLNFFNYKENNFINELSQLTIEKLDEIYSKQRSLKEKYPVEIDLNQELKKRIANEINAVCNCCNKFARKAVHYSEFEEQGYILESLFKSIEKHTKIFHAHQYEGYNDPDKFIGLFPVPSRKQQFSYRSLSIPLETSEKSPALDEMFKSIELNSTKPKLSEFERGIIEGFKPISVMDFIKKYCKVDIEKKLGQLEIESVQKEFLPFTYKLCGFVDRKDLETFMKSYMLDIQTLLVTHALEKINYIDPFKVRDKYEEEHKQLQELTQQLDATKKELQTKISDNNEQETKIELQSKEIDTLKESVEKLTSEKSDLQKEYDELAAKYNDLKSKIAGLL